MKLITNVLEIRKELGMTQREFAKAMDVSLFTVQAWEHGRRDISKRHKIKIGTLAHLDIAETKFRNSLASD